MNLTVVDYVRKYFKLNFLTYYNALSKEERDSVIYSISDNLPKDDPIKIKLGNFDKRIYLSIDKYINNRFSKLRTDYVNFRNYIIKYITDHYIVKYSNKTLNCITSKIIDKLIPSFDYNKLMDGEYDRDIEITYENVVNKLCDEMRLYIQRYIIRTVSTINDVNQIKIAEYIVKDIMTTGKYSADDLLLRKLDSVINERILDYRSKVEKTKPDSISYIFRYVLHHLEHISEGYEIMHYTMIIDDRLRKNGYNAKDICSGKLDNTISNLYVRLKMKQNSIQKEDTPKKIKRNGKKRKLPQGVSILLVTATLLGAVGVGTLAVKVVDGVSDFVSDIKNTKKIEALDEFDGFDYSYIFVKDTDAFKTTALNAVSFYEKVQDQGYGNGNFDYIGFYRAYDNVRDQRLYIMDEMLSVIQSYANKDEKNMQLYKQIAFDSCYLEFAMNRLEDMGCEEIRDDKYMSALSAYKEAMWKSSGEAPIEKMSSKDRKVVEEIMAKYQEYSEQLMVEFGTLVLNNQTISNGNGKGM